MRFEFQAQPGEIVGRCRACGMMYRHGYRNHGWEKHRKEMLRAMEELNALEKFELQLRRGMRE